MPPSKPPPQPSLRQRQENCEFEASLGYMTLSQNNNNNNKITTDFFLSQERAKVLK
jgi:phage anti-repressor protein